MRSWNSERVARPTFPLAEFCNLEIDEVGRGHAVGTVHIDHDRHANPHGVLHGGVLFTAVDTTMGVATQSLLEPGQICATIEIQVRFFRPMVAGTLHADVQVVNEGRKVVHLLSHVSDGGGRQVALAVGSFAVLDDRSAQATPV